ncbi:MAG TPA: PAS domain S-box protein [Stellaceae bacterium]|nr:PAS domain S-box protein [Stellaceae bacterium]
MGADPPRSEATLAGADTIAVTRHRGGTVGTLRSTFDHAAVGVAHVALDGRFLRVNRKLCDIMGYAQDELLRRRFHEITYRDDLGADLTLLRRAIAGEIATFSMEKRYIRGDGAIIWADLTVSIVRDAAHQPLYCVSIISDITARKRTEEALRESEQRLGLALEAGKLGSWSLDLTTEAFEISARGKAFFGLPADAELTYRTLLSMIHPEDLADKLRAVEQAVASGGDYEWEFRAIWANGSVHWIMARGRPIYDAGRPLRMVGAFLDTTERNRAREELQQLNETLERRVRERTRQLRNEIDERARAEAAQHASDARYAAVFEHTATGLILLSVTADGRYLYEAVNPSHEKTSGRKAAEFIGKTPYDMFPHALGDRLAERFHRCCATGAPITYEDAYPYPAGTRINLSTAVPIRDTEGRIAKILVSTHDLTERKATEEALRQSQKMEAIGLLTGGVAHDFNNLLTSVLGNLELSAQRALDPALRRLLDGASRAAERGAKLTQQLLAFARKQRLERKAVDLNRLVAGMTDMMVATIGATIRIETPPGKDLWPAMVDVNQLELVILNLAINARDAMPNGGVLTIETENVRVSRGGHPGELPDGDYVMLALKDNGTGMSEEVKAKAFEPFFTTKQVGRGSGLGLSQVYGIASQLGGGVDIDSRPGAGTTVRVYLPRAAQAALEPRGTAERIDLTTRRPARILVVDDDGDVREFIASCLASFGYDVIEAVDAKDALDIAARDAAIDLLLIDYAMPEMNGAELLFQMRRQRPQLKALFITGYAPDAFVDGEIDGVAVVRKPFKLAELASRLRAALGDAPAERPLAG